MARANAFDEDVSQSVRDLVETVGRLGNEDQERILRMVTLLAQATGPVQAATKRMLRDLIDSDPITAGDCIAQVDEVIGYLEENIDPLDSELLPELQARPPLHRLN